MCEKDEVGDNQSYDHLLVCHSWFFILQNCIFKDGLPKTHMFKLHLYPGVRIIGSKFRKLDSFRISKNLLSGILTVILFKSLISLCWQQWEQELLFLREAGQRSYLKRANFKGRRSNNLLSHNTSLHWHSPWLLHINFVERIRTLKNNTRSFHFLLVTVLYWKKLISINVSWGAILLTILSGKNHHMFFPSPIPIHMFCDTGFSFFSCIQEHVQSNFQSLFVHIDKLSLQTVSAEIFLNIIVYQKALK